MTREDMLTALRSFSRPSMEDKEAIAAQIQADGETIARLEAERNEAQGDADMANDAIRCVRNELQAGPAIPVAAFVDDHVRNAVVMLAEEDRKRRETEHLLRRIVDAKALRTVREMVAGWNGENLPNGKHYERHRSRLGARIETNCGRIYELDEALVAARAALRPADKGDAK